MGKARLLNKPSVTDQMLNAAATRGAHVATVFAEKVMDQAPVESGHIHEAMLNAVDKSGISADFPGASALSSVFGGMRSGDPEAKKRGHGAKRKGAKRYRVRFLLNLPFAATLSKGGTIRVGDAEGNKGTKVPGTRFPGPLYGPRLSKGKGVLMWKQGGKIMRARVRRVPATNFWSLAAALARVMASQLGLKER